MDTTWIVVWVLIGLALGGIAFFFIWMEARYKHTVICTDLGKQGIELQFKAREVIIDGVPYWRLAQERNKELKNMPLPPANAINIGKKGNKRIECVRTETGEYIFLDKQIHIPSSQEYIQLKKELANIPAAILGVKDNQERSRLTKEWRDAKLENWREKTNGICINAHKPFTTPQRMVLMNNFIKANAKKTFNWKEAIVPITAIAGLVVIVVSMFIFWGDIAKPALDSKQLTAQIEKTQLEIVSILQDIRRSQQTITGITPINKTNIPN